MRKKGRPQEAPKHDVMSKFLESSSSTGAMCSPSIRDVRDHNLGWNTLPKTKIADSP